MNTGVKIKKYIEFENKTNILVVKEIVSFNMDDVKKRYIQDFNQLVDDGIIEDCSFNDSIWKAIDEFEVAQYLKFNFEINPELNTALKCFALLKLSEQYSSVGNCYKAITTISKMLIASNFFNDDYVENFNIYLKNCCDSDKRSIGFIKEFLNFHQLIVSEKYHQLINSLPYIPSNSRILPCYSSIITFDYLIEDFISNDYLQSKSEFIPIIIWWELTKIIPMRPIEFAILKRNCLSTKDNEYFIKIERRKEKGGKVKYKTVKILTNLKIPYRLYKIISEYINSTSNIATGNFIFSNEVYKSLNNRRYKESNLDFIGMNNLRKLLNTFFTEIISDKYGYEVISKNEMDCELKDYEIEKLQLGDTRHIAFCGMMLQGFNPLTIAQIGGHYTLTEQCSYCNHLDTFVNSHTYVLTKSIRNKIIKNVSSNIPMNKNIASKNNLVLKEKLGNDFYLFPKVRGGRCKNKNFPYDCKSDSHIGCNDFIPDETLTYELLNDELNTVDTDIESKLKYIKSVTQTAHDFKTSNNIEAELKTNTNCLNTLIKQKATIDSYRLNMLEDMKNE